MAILFSGAEPFEQFQMRALWEHLSEIILNLDEGFKRDCLKISSVIAILLNGPYEEHLCKNIINLDDGFKRDC